eukprot:5791347-Alexandrium_andersonii.AAC.1
MAPPRRLCAPLLVVRPRRALPRLTRELPPCSSNWSPCCTVPWHCRDQCLCSPEAREAESKG